MISKAIHNVHPVFILGITQRSGTNFLHDLLCLHPDCIAGGIIWEDYLVAHTDLIVRYVESVYRHWNPSWKVEEIMGSPDLLCEYIGNALISFLSAQIIKKQAYQKSGLESASSFPKKMVTKTPSVNNIRHFFKIFPDCHLLIIIRDGRSVIESGIKSFNWDYEQSIRKWAGSAHNILDFNQNNQNKNHKYMIVRYEDLYSETEKELKRIFTFLCLDVGKYNFDAAMNLPIRGSSDQCVQEEKKIHWMPIEKTSNFNPINRWGHWGTAKHERFNWIAGKYLSQFGYAKKMQGKNRFLWFIWNVILDIKWGARRIFNNPPLSPLS